MIHGFDTLLIGGNSNRCLSILVLYFARYYKKYQTNTSSSNPSTLPFPSCQIKTTRVEILTLNYSHFSPRSSFLFYLENPQEINTHSNSSRSALTAVIVVSGWPTGSCPKSPTVMVSVMCLFSVNLHKRKWWFRRQSLCDRMVGIALPTFQICRRQRPQRTFKALLWARRAADRRGYEVWSANCAIPTACSRLPLVDTARARGDSWAGLGGLAFVLARACVWDWECCTRCVHCRIAHNVLHRYTIESIH